MQNNLPHFIIPNSTLVSPSKSQTCPPCTYIYTSPLPISFPATLLLPCSIISLQFASFQELANPQETLEETQNEGVVIALYDALKIRDAEAIQKILAPDLEWWFHGPPSHQFLMRLLTGTAEEDTDTSFTFLPHRISAFGSTVLVEGFDQTRSISWVHAWTVDGIITQVREYFNTSLTVTRFGKTDKSDYDNITSLHCPSLWESRLPNRVGKSVPGLVLAI